MRASDLKKGNRIKITGNEIFAMMGYKVVTGKVFSFHSSGAGVSFQCEQTGAIEGADFDDGDWEGISRD